MSDADKPFQCEYCAKKFAYRKQLRNHVKCHTKYGRVFLKLLQRGVSSADLVHIPYPDTEKQLVAADGTVWSNVPELTTHRRAYHYWHAREGKAGIRRHVPLVAAAETRSELLSLFFTDSVVAKIVMWTNKKAQDDTNRWNIENPDRPQKRWEPTDAVEIRAFIGLLIMAGVHKLRKLTTEKLWRSDPRYKHHPFVATMARTRFRQLMRFLRFDDLSTRPARKKEDKLAAISETFNEINENFRIAYEPYEYLTTDEMLIPFRGRFFARVYMKSKPGKYGIKVWGVADSKTRYVTNMQVLKLINFH